MVYRRLTQQLMLEVWEAYGIHLMTGEGLERVGEGLERVGVGLLSLVQQFGKVSQVGNMVVWL